MRWGGEVIKNENKNRTASPPRYDQYQASPLARVARTTPVMEIPVPASDQAARSPIAAPPQARNHGAENRVILAAQVKCGGDTSAMRKFSRSSPKSSHWNLYWVESDGIEDCFVVARNSRSACRVEIDQNGFDAGHVRATRVMRIPQDVEISYRKTNNRGWPWYPYGRAFFEKLGAQFRTANGTREMLLGDVVYEIEDYVPCSIVRARSVGQRAVSELTSDPELAQYPYHDEDRWEGPVIHLITALGICLATCQQIEDYVSKSFLLGVSKIQKQKYKTLNDLRDGWKRKTLGNMFKSIEEAWEIESTLKANLELFLINRNRLIHGITTDEQFDIRTHWGREELLAFLSFFDVHARIVKSA